MWVKREKKLHDLIFLRMKRDLVAKDNLFRSVAKKTWHLYAHYVFYLCLILLCHGHDVQLLLLITDIILNLSCQRLICHFSSAHSMRLLCLKLCVLLVCCIIFSSFLVVGTSQANQFLGRRWKLRCMHLAW
jgi:hypothetical protein